MQNVPIRPRGVYTGIVQTIYLDHNATTPLLPEAAEAMDRARTEAWANPASQHGPGRRARRFVEDARDRIGEILGADRSGMHADRVIFTSGGTEANNLALLGLAAGFESAAGTPAVGLLSSVEHPSVRGPAARLAARGWAIETVPVDADGRIVPAKFDQLLRDEVRFASIQLGNNETGVLQPIAELAEACRRRNVVLHTDAVQCVGKVPVAFRALGVDLLTATAHKLHGPTGIGLLVVRRSASIEPLFAGGFQQEGFRPGTESPLLVAGLLAALEAAQREGADRTRRLAALRDDFEARLTSQFPELVVHGRNAPRLPQTSNIAFLGVDRQALFLALDQAGLACSTGSACASGSSEPSPTLLGMGLPPREIESSLRFSVGTTTTAAEIVAAVERISFAYSDLRQREAARKKPVSGRSTTEIAI